MSKVPRHDRAAAADTGDGNLIARARAATKLRDDFERELRASLTADLRDVTDWLTWASRLSQVLGEMLNILLRGPAGTITLVFEDQSAFLSSSDTGIAVAALRLAAGTGDASSVLYRSLARRLGSAS